MAWAQRENRATASWAGAQATAGDRRVTFSSARRFCDQLLILNAAGGYHDVVGMDRISVNIGHSA
jgi:hypothetical protein